MPTGTRALLALPLDKDTRRVGEGLRPELDHVRRQSEGQAQARAALSVLKGRLPAGQRARGEGDDQAAKALVGAARGQAGDQLDPLGQHGAQLVELVFAGGTHLRGRRGVDVWIDATGQGRGAQAGP